MRVAKLIFFILCLGHGLSGIAEMDTLGFVSPVKHTIQLTGNFMELRPNHFHAGLDIKSTQGVVGDPIHSIQDGYISRIKVQSGGYGNALYIDHPSGHTSVYAHLDEYIPEIAELLNSVQYKVESYEIDIYLPDSLIRVVQGQKIGTMGNSGRSFGPHLHFEIRESETEKPLNPELFGIGPEDTSAPVLQSLQIHSLSEEQEVVAKSIKYFNPKKKKYTLHQDTIIVNSKQVGLALEMFDRMDGSWNKNGIYGFQLRIDDKPHFAWKADEFSFDETRLINGFWDYESQHKHGQKVYLLYRLSCNPFSYYASDSNGLIELDTEKSREVEIIVIDAKKNRSTVKFFIKADTYRTMASDVLDCDSVYFNQSTDFKVSIPQGAFYSPNEVAYSEGHSMILGQQVKFLTINDPGTPIKKKIELKAPIPPGYDGKWIFATTDSKGRYLNFGGDTIGGSFVCRIDQLGTYYLLRDTEAPDIKVIQISKNLSKPWKFKVVDAFRDDGEANEIGYRGTINGAWIKLQYDKKNDLLIFDDKERLPSTGPISLEIEVWDHCHNIQKYTKSL